MYNFSKYYDPYSINDALTYFATQLKPVLIAGGTDVLIKMREGLFKDSSLISLRNIDELKTIELQEDGSIRIGSMVTFKRMIEDKIINEQVPILKLAANSLGGPQIRSVATIGGNLCNGAPSADSAPSLLALDAQLEFKSLQGIRNISINDFYLGPYKIKKEPNEILTAIIIPAMGKNFGGHYIKFSTRKAMDIATLSCAVTCWINDNSSSIKQLKIALGTAGPMPFRCRKVEAIAQNQELSEELMEEISRATVKEANPRTSWRATKEFRQALIAELVQRALSEAYEKAKGVK